MSCRDPPRWHTGIQPNTRWHPSMSRHRTSCTKAQPCNCCFHHHLQHHLQHHQFHRLHRRHRFHRFLQLRRPRHRRASTACPCRCYRLGKARTRCMRRSSKGWRHLRNANRSRNRSHPKSPARRTSCTGARSDTCYRRFRRFARFQWSFRQHHRCHPGSRRQCLRAPQMPPRPPRRPGARRQTGLQCQFRPHRRMSLRHPSSTMGPHQSPDPARESPRRRSSRAPSPQSGISSLEGKLSLSS